MSSEGNSGLEGSSSIVPEPNISACRDGYIKLQTTEMGNEGRRGPALKMSEKELRES